MQFFKSVTRSLIPGVLRLNSLRFSPMIAPLNLIRSFFVAAMPLSYVYVNASPGIGPLCRGVSTMLFQNDGSGRSTGRNSGHSKFSSVLYSSTSIVEKEDVGLDVNGVKEMLKEVDAICFDVDSTLIAEEGIDILAEYKGKGEQVAALTRQAMEGKAVSFREALEQRLHLIQPNFQDIQTVLEQHPPVLSPGIDKVISVLHTLGIHVYIISGGFRQMIEPVAIQLHIPLHRVYANHLIFDTMTGAYNGFDKQEYTSQDGGKPAVIQLLKDSYEYKKIIMVGDGATDMQARPPADKFIGYGGVSERANVKEGADWYIYNFDTLYDALMEIKQEKDLKNDESKQT
jgi:phosphoserine phosphatase